MKAGHLSFRKHPDVGAAGKVTILGKARCSAERMTAYARRRNPSLPDFASLYLQAGERYGVRGDVAYCQALYDTRAWTMAPAGPPWSPFAFTLWTSGGWREGCGGGQDDNRSGKGFVDELDVDNQFQLLRAFALGDASVGEQNTVADTADAADEQSFDAESEIAGKREFIGGGIAFAEKSEMADRFLRLKKAGWLGTVAHWEELSGKWLVPGTKYGQDVVAIWRGMIEWQGEGEVYMAVDEHSNGEQAWMADVTGRGYSVNGSVKGYSANGGIGSDNGGSGSGTGGGTTAELEWLLAEGLLSHPTPRPNGYVTWSDLASLLRKLEDRGK